MLDPAADRVLFGKVGWMKSYDGVRPGDPAPTNGGEYNRTQGIGAEVVNFRKQDGFYYGYFRPKNASRVSLERIEPILPRVPREVTSVDGVTVVWVAPHSDGGVYPVGWYREATVYRSFQHHPTPVRHPDLDDDDHVFICRTAVANGHLIAEEDRLDWPRVRTTGAGAMGQTNHRFPRYSPDSWDWVKPILKRIP